MNRREYLGATVTVLAGGIAGCTGSSGGSAGSDESDTPTPVESGEVTSGSDDHYVETAAGDLLRVQINDLEPGASAIVDIIDPDNDNVVREEGIESEQQVTHEATQDGDYRVIVFARGTISYEIFVE